MQTWAKRGMQTALVTGGLLMLGTGIASADDSVNPDAPAGPLDLSIPFPVEMQGNSLGSLGGQHELPDYHGEISTQPLVAPVTEPLTEAAAPVTAPVNDALGKLSAPEAMAPLTTPVNNAMGQLAEAAAPVAAPVQNVLGNVTAAAPQTAGVTEGVPAVTLPAPHPASEAAARDLPGADQAQAAAEQFEMGMQKTKAAADTFVANLQKGGQTLVDAAPKTLGAVVDAAPQTVGTVSDGISGFAADPTSGIISGNLVDAMRTEVEETLPIAYVVPGQVLDTVLGVNDFMAPANAKEDVDTTAVDPFADSALPAAVPPSLPGGARPAVAKADFPQVNFLPMQAPNAETLQAAAHHLSAQLPGDPFGERPTHGIMPVDQPGHTGGPAVAKVAPKAGPTKTLPQDTMPVADGMGVASVDQSPLAIYDRLIAELSGKNMHIQNS